MPYKNLAELPEDVRKRLPEEAQKLYARAYNTAWERYRILQDEETKRSELAWKSAWAEVERVYEEKGETGRWHRKTGTL